MFEEITPISAQALDKIVEERISSISSTTDSNIQGTAPIGLRTAVRQYPQDHEFSRSFGKSALSSDKGFYEKLAADITSWLESSYSNFTCTFTIYNNKKTVHAVVQGCGYANTELGKAMFTAIFEHWYASKCKEHDHQLRVEHIPVTSVNITFK